MEKKKNFLTFSVKSVLYLYFSLKKLFSGVLLFYIVILFVIFIILILIFIKIVNFFNIFFSKAKRSIGPKNKKCLNLKEEKKNQMDASSRKKATSSHLRECEKQSLQSFQIAILLYLWCLEGEASEAVAPP